MKMHGQKNINILREIWNFTAATDSQVWDLNLVTVIRDINYTMYKKVLKNYNHKTFIYNVRQNGRLGAVAVYHTKYNILWNKVTLKALLWHKIDVAYMVRESLYVMWNC
jgi:hypothetical protein